MGVLEHNNRLDYGQVLMPDEGWTTSWAIGTTYSLELEILMSVPLALFHSKYLSEKTDIRNLRADMLDALNKVKDRMFVFVHENNISANCGFSMLMSFLDQNIWNIELDSVSKNFHPKVWLVRYENAIENKFKYRLIVMSKNMTAATDFDIAAIMESYAVANKHNDNEALSVMMTTLMERTGQKMIIRQMKEELKRIRFQAPEPFEQKEPIFWPHTYKSLKCPLRTDHEYDELLVISPFIDNKTLNYLANKTNGKPILVSREYEMDKCDPDELAKWDCYQWNSLLEEASDYEENETSEDEVKSYGISLHAKIFIARAALGRDYNIWNNWFIGSSNCTQAALRTNYEAMLQLRSNREGTSPDEIKKSLYDSALISEYKVKEAALYQDEVSAQIDMREIVYAVSHLKFNAKYTKDEQGRYITDVEVNKDDINTFVENHPKVKVTMELFASNHGTWTITKKEYHHQFKTLLCQHLSPFVRITIKVDDEKKSFLLKLPIEMPSERHGKIMAEILDNEEKLMRYMIFCLDPLISIDQQKIGSELQKSHAGKGDIYQEYSLPLYERLLLAASRDHQALAEIDKNVKRLKDAKGKDGKPLLSKAFMKMWNLFAAYTK